jgi:hypothetical protein
VGGSSNCPSRTKTSAGHVEQGREAMSDLMPCQMCGGEAAICDDSQDFYDGLVRAGCWTCGCRGKKVDFDENYLRYQLQCEKHEPEAARLWNEMQTYIARGKLLDAAPPPTRARL